MSLTYREREGGETARREKESELKKEEKKKTCEDQNRQF